LAKVTETVHPSGAVNYHFKLQGGPPVMDKCPECDGVLHVRKPELCDLSDADLQQMAGPMWSAPIHNPEFIGKVLEHLEENEAQYGTASRMKGMLTVAKEASVVKFSTRWYSLYSGTPRQCILLYACQGSQILPLPDTLFHRYGVSFYSLLSALLTKVPVLRCCMAGTRYLARTPPLGRSKPRPQMQRSLIYTATGLSSIQ
jgi:tRNA (guanine26-N2/guanine27-N2)-dimethyltransferase